MTPAKSIKMERISKLITRELSKTGWKVIYKTGGGTVARKRIEGYEQDVIIAIDITGRWLARVDIWDKEPACVDLRNYSNNPKGAINTVLGMEQTK